MLRIPDPADAGAWSVRVVANKFPALSPEAKLIFTERGRHFQEMEGYGAHEVAVESPDHFRPLALQPFTQIERVLEALQARYRTLMLVPGLRAIIVFKNHGPAAGTSLRHPHWQIIAPPAVPRLLREKHAIATSYFDHAFKRLHTVLLEEELAAGVRVLAVNDAFAAVLPYASHVPYQVRIQPRTYRGGFSRAARGDLQSLAAILREVLGRLYAALGDPAFNLNLVSPPITDEDEEYFQWHIDVLPRLMVTAGFEMGSGVAINPVPPEAAAEALRAAVPPTQDC